MGAAEIDGSKGTVTRDSRFARSSDNVEKQLWREILIQIGIRQWALAIQIPLPQELRLILLLGHPTGQDKQGVAEAIEKSHEGRIQRLFPPNRTQRRSARRQIVLAGCNKLEIFPPLENELSGA